MVWCIEFKQKNTFTIFCREVVKYLELETELASAQMSSEL
jgi:hypothetical protein